MRLEDIKATIDSYFDNISEQELFDLLTGKYRMPAVYDIDLAAKEVESAENIFTGFSDIEYELLPAAEHFVRDMRIKPLQSDMVSTDFDYMSDALSFAA